MRYGALVLLLIAAIISNATHAQNLDELDSMSTKVLDPVTVKGFHDKKQAIPDIVGVNIFAGKKTEVVDLENGDANLVQNVGRMVYAKMPGVNLWDMDGAGTQMNIGTRGTDAHRSIEMNMRQNGYNTNSDIFGYPENHYQVPMQGVKQVQLLRGSAALQFGSQYGGMMNYVMKEGDSTKVFSLESEQTLGANNLFNSYNAIGGTKGKVSYYAYYNNRHGDGWRPNSAFNFNAWYANVKYRFSNKGSVALQFSRMDYRQQIAGGLTDEQFEENARQSDRARNYFSPIINVPAVTFNYQLSPTTSLELTANGIWGERSSIQFINPATVKDTFNTDIGSYNPRQIDRDFYSSFTTEARLLHEYSLGKVRSILSGGIRYFDGKTRRRQKGGGTTGADFDFSLVTPYGTDLKFLTINYAAFAENIFYLNRRFSVTPGFRYEVIKSDLTGVINNATFPVSFAGKRNFLLFGTGLQYQLTDDTQLYGNISQAYRPYLYANITPADQLGIVDPNLKDSRGYDIDAGYRGSIGNLLNFDVNGYYLFYGDRIGKVTMQGSGDTSYLFTTNVGNSEVKGLEMYLNLSLLGNTRQEDSNTDLRVFSSLAYTNARYLDVSVANGNQEVSLNGNHVENVPDWIERAGLEFKHKRLSSTLQVSYVSEQFNDANNTVFSESGIVGVIPSYTVIDWAFNLGFLDKYHLSGGVNNLADTRYFSRRIQMYPGPGILPANGRTFYLTLGGKF